MLIVRTEDPKRFNNFIANFVKGLFKNRLLGHSKFENVSQFRLARRLNNLSQIFSKFEILKSSNFTKIKFENFKIFVTKLIPTVGR